SLQTVPNRYRRRAAAAIPDAAFRTWPITSRTVGVSQASGTASRAARAASVHALVMAASATSGATPADRTTAPTGRPIAAAAAETAIPGRCAAKNAGHDALVRRRLSCDIRT